MKTLLTIFTFSVAVAFAQNTTVPANGANRPAAPSRPPILNPQPLNPTTPPPVPNAPPPNPMTPPPMPTLPPPAPNTPPPMPNTPPPIAAVPGANGQVVPPGITPGINNPNAQPALNQNVQSAFNSQPLNQTPVPTNTVNNNGYGFNHVPTNGFGQNWRTNAPGWPNNNEALITNGAPSRM